MSKFLVFLYRNLSLLEHLVKRLLTMFSPDTDWSKVTPKYFTFVFASMMLVPHDTVTEFTWCRRCLDPNRIDSVLPRCKDNLLSISYSLMDSSSTLSTLSISVVSFPDTSSAESSAYNMSLQFVAAVISFTYIKNSRGPSMEPCGTPHVMFLVPDSVPFTSTTCVLPTR